MLPIFCFRRLFPQSSLVLPNFSYCSQVISDNQKEINQLKKIVRKEGLKKKVQRKFEADISRLELKERINRGSQQLNKVPLTKNELANHETIKEQFKSLPYEDKTLDYIRKHGLHRSKEVPRVRQAVNSFVDKTFSTEDVRIRVCKGKSKYPEYTEGERHPEIALVGRSNAGKSSLIGALLPELKNSQAPRISNVPGQTRAIHFIQLPAITIVDLPGYGYSMKENKVQEWDEFTKEYLSERSKLRRICILIDSRHGLKSSDFEYMNYLEQQRKKFQIILTKVDLVDEHDVARIYTKTKESLKQYRRALDRVMMISSQTKTGIPLLKKELASLAYTGPRKMEISPFVRIGEPLPKKRLTTFGINSKFHQKQIYGARGRVALSDSGRAGRARR